MVSRSVEMMVLDMYHIHALQYSDDLKREDLSITDVAYQLDFNTTNYFTRYVKHVLGMTPSQYKAKFSVKNREKSPHQ